MCVPIDPFLISGAPRRCIRRTTGDCRGGQSSLWDTDVVGAEISEVFILLCFGCCGRLWLGGGGGGGGGGGVCSDVARRVASFMRATACLMGILVGEGL